MYAVLLMQRYNNFRPLSPLATVVFLRVLQARRRKRAKLELNSNSLRQSPHIVCALSDVQESPHGDGVSAAPTQRLVWSQRRWHHDEAIVTPSGCSSVLCVDCGCRLSFQRIVRFPKTGFLVQILMIMEKVKTS